MPKQAPLWTVFLLCPVCHNEFAIHRLPISLGCGHTICRVCLVKLHNGHCPFDHTPVTTDVVNLPINSALLQLVSNGSSLGGASSSVGGGFAGQGICKNNVHNSEPSGAVGASSSGGAESLLTQIPPSVRVLNQDDLRCYNTAKEYIENLALHLRSFVNNFTSPLSRPLQRKLVTLINCQLIGEQGRIRALRAARMLGERAVTELILQHQKPDHLNTNLWASVRSRGCQFLGPSMQEEVLRLILLALQDGSSLSRKVLVMFVVQRLGPSCAQVSKTSIGHVVQLLYRADCFKTTKREANSTLMQLKEEFRTYDALRRQNDAQIIQIATEAGLRIAPEQWSSLLYGDILHKSYMMDIIDKLPTPSSFAQSIQQLLIAMQRAGDPASLKNLRKNLKKFDFIDPSPNNAAPTWENLVKVLDEVRQVVHGLVEFIQQHGNRKLPDSAGARGCLSNTKYKISLCRELKMCRVCPRGTSCTFAHSEAELQRYRAKSRRTAKSSSPEGAASTGTPVPDALPSKKEAAHNKPLRSTAIGAASRNSSIGGFNCDSTAPVVHAFGSISQAARGHHKPISLPNSPLLGFAASPFGKNTRDSNVGVASNAVPQMSYPVVPLQAPIMANMSSINLSKQSQQQNSTAGTVSKALINNGLYNFYELYNTNFINFFNPSNYPNVSKYQSYGSGVDAKTRLDHNTLWEQQQHQTQSLTNAAPIGLVNSSLNGGVHNLSQHNIYGSSDSKPVSSSAVAAAATVFFSKTYSNPNMGTIRQQTNATHNNAANNFIFSSADMGSSEGASANSSSSGTSAISGIGLFCPYSHSANVSITADSLLSDTARAAGGVQMNPHAFWKSCARSPSQMNGYAETTERDRNAKTFGRADSHLLDDEGLGSFRPKYNSMSDAFKDFNVTESKANSTDNFLKNWNTSNGVVGKFPYPTKVSNKPSLLDDSGEKLPLNLLSNSKVLPAVTSVARPVTTLTASVPPAQKPIALKKNHTDSLVVAFTRDFVAKFGMDGLHSQGEVLDDTKIEKNCVGTDVLTPAIWGGDGVDSLKQAAQPDSDIWKRHGVISAVLKEHQRTYNAEDPELELVGIVKDIWSTADNGGIKLE